MTTLTSSIKEDTGPATEKKQPERRPRRPNYVQIHARPLPLETYPLPAFHPNQPLSLLHLAWTLLKYVISTPSSHAELKHLSYYSPGTRSVHVTNHATARALWESGFFGKGSLSRSEPEWLDRERKRLGLVEKSDAQTAAETTQKRRAERFQAKRERARLEREALEEQLRIEGKLAELSVAHSEAAEKQEELRLSDSNPAQDLDSTAPLPASQLTEVGAEQMPLLENQEHLQLVPVEAFFLVYALGTLSVLHPTTQEPLAVHDLLRLFRRTSVFPPLSSTVKLPPDDPFMINYVVYHHFRSLGWVIRGGVKFSVDYMLYIRGPVFSHAEFAAIIVPDYSAPAWSATEERRTHVARCRKNEWWWVHCMNRVQSQVKKTLVLVYVEIPPPDDVEDDRDIGALIKQYRVREFVLRRWVSNRNR